MKLHVLFNRTTNSIGAYCFVQVMIKASETFLLIIVLLFILLVLSIENAVVISLSMVVSRYLRPCSAA